MLSVELLRAAILAAREREQAALAEAGAARADMLGYIRHAVERDAMTVIQIAEAMGVTRYAIYKMLREQRPGLGVDEIEAAKLDARLSGE